MRVSCLHLPWTMLGATALALSIVGGGRAEPPDDDPRTGDLVSRECPGRLHQGADPADVHAPDGPFATVEPPPLIWFRAGRYGIVWAYPDPEIVPPHARTPPPAGYRADVYHIVDCPQAPAGDRFVGLDHLITLMGHEGLKLYRSGIESMESGPDGIIAAGDVVVIKINYQWPERGGTNVDLLRGLIRRIVDHPDTFTGEIAVCENTQFASVEDFDRPNNNAEDIGLSPRDVVLGFQGEGYDVSLYDWSAIRSVEVSEYADGDYTAGYVAQPYDAQLNGRVSYPKFETEYGTSVSLKLGIWDRIGETYDRASLKFINVPVFKSHHAVYGVTACVKNYMGVVTGLLGTNSHNAIANGILGAVLGEIQPADLNILDCIWVNANPYDGPWTLYAGSTRRDELVASVDPVAADLWAVINILEPAFIANGYTPPWPDPSADPDDPASAFRNYLDNSMEHILSAGYDATNDPGSIDAVTWSGGGDLEGDGVPDASDNCPYDHNPLQEDCDGDGVGDLCAILEGLSQDCNVNGVPDGCECAADLDGSCAVGAIDLLALLAAWGPCGVCGEDLDADGTVGVIDLLTLLAAWGPC